MPSSDLLVKIDDTSSYLKVEGKKLMDKVPSQMMELVIWRWWQNHSHGKEGDCERGRLRPIEEREAAGRAHASLAGFPSRGGDRSVLPLG